MRKRTGFIRRQTPRYDWKDRPLGTWLTLYLGYLRRAFIAQSGAVAIAKAQSKRKFQMTHFGIHKS